MVSKRIKIKRIRYMKLGGISKVFLINGTNQDIDLFSFFKAQKRKKKIKKLYEQSSKLV